MQVQRIEAKLMKSSKTSLHSCQRYHGATFCQSKRSRKDKTEPENANNYRASKKRIIKKTWRTSKGGRTVKGWQSQIVGQFPGCSEVQVERNKDNSWDEVLQSNSAALRREKAGQYLCVVWVKLCRLRCTEAATYPQLPSGECAGCFWLSSTLYLRRPLSMKHKSPQLLSPSPFSTSASTGASMEPETGTLILTGAQSWVGEPGTRLLGERKSSPRGRGDDSPHPPVFQPTAGHFPALTVPQSGKPDFLPQGLPSLLQYLGRNSRDLP